MCNFRYRERSATPSRRQATSEGRDDSAHSASTRTGRDVTRASPSPRLTSSLPRPIQPSPASQREIARPKTPLLFQKTPNQLSLHQQPAVDHSLAQTWNKSQLSSKLRQSTTPRARSTEANSRGPSLGNSQRQVGLGSAKATVPERCRSPIKKIYQGPKQVHMTSQLAEGHQSPSEGTDLIRSFSPMKQVRDEVWGEPRSRPLTPIKGESSRHGPVQQMDQKKPTPDSTQAAPLNSISNGNFEPTGKHDAGISRQNALRLPTSQRGPFQGSNVCVGVTEAKMPVAKPQDFQELNSKDGGKEGKELERGCLFTPPPITPAQEASLYQSLEQEILSNMQLLSTESDEDSSEGEQENSCLETPLNRQENSSGHFSVLSEQPLCSMQHVAQGRSASEPSDANQVSHDAGTTEPSTGKRPVSRVDVESWVATLPRSPRVTQPPTCQTEVASGHQRRSP